MKTREQKYVLLREQTEKAEDAVVRTTKKWIKLRAALTRAGKRLDKELGERHSKVAGQLDVRVITAPTKPEILDDHALLTEGLNKRRAKPKPATADTAPPAPAGRSPRPRRRASPPPAPSRGGI